MTSQATSSKKSYSFNKGLEVSFDRVDSIINKQDSILQKTLTSLPPLESTDSQSIIQDLGTLTILRAQTVKFSKANVHKLVYRAETLHYNWLHSEESKHTIRSWLEFLSIVTSGFGETMITNLSKIGYDVADLDIGNIPGTRGERKLYGKSPTIDRVRAAGIISLLALGKTVNADNFTAYIEKRVDAANKTVSNCGLSTGMFSTTSMQFISNFLASCETVRIYLFTWLYRFSKSKSCPLSQPIADMVVTLLKGSGQTHIQIIMCELRPYAFVFGLPEFAEETELLMKHFDRINQIQGILPGYEKIMMTKEDYGELTAKQVPLLTTIALKLAQEKASTLSKWVSPTLTDTQREITDRTNLLLSKIMELKRQKATVQLVSALNMNQDVAEIMVNLTKTVVQSGVETGDTGAAAQPEKRGIDEVDPTPGPSSSR